MGNRYSKILKVYNLGSEGIDLVNSPIHAKPGALTNAQNATIRPVQGNTGITKRDGMAKINSVAAAGSLAQIINIPINSIGDDATCNVTSPDLEWSAGAWSHDLGLFAVVGTSGTGNRVITSPDGVTWTSRTSAADITWNDICWHDEIDLFVAVGEGGSAATQVMTSPDGITWTSRTAAADRNWEGVCYSPDLNLFVAVANSGAAAGMVMTSPDGINWTSRTASIVRGWNKVCWADTLTLFVAVGATNSQTNDVMTSPDGINWTTRDPGVAANYYDVAWSNELGILVAVGEADPSAVPKIIYSTDGTTWTETATSLASDNRCRSIAWSSIFGVFVAANYANDAMYVSSNGTTWQNVSTNCAESVMDDVVWASTIEKFLLIGQDSGGAAVMEVF